MPTPARVYQLKITLKDSTPPIWRRVLVPENVTLFELHEIIQRVMGWQDYHLHQFTIAGQLYGNPEDDEFGDLNIENEKRYRLNQFGFREKSKFSYEYDFGDSWEHTLLVEKILPAEKGGRYPVCTAGKRACPPEDCGGICGYEEFLETIANPEDEEHDETLEWVGGDFDPEEFDLDEVNAALQAIKPARGRRKAQMEPALEGKSDDFMSSADEQEKIEDLVKWVQSLSREQVAGFENLPLRRDVITFLDYLSNNRVLGTQSTGNLPLKAVHEISARFTHPPKLEETVGEHVYKVRSEDDVRSLLFVHQLAFQSRLVTGGQAKTWKTTDEGQQFPLLPPPVQVFFLLVHWWVQIDWTIAFPVSGLANGLPGRFKPEALASLRGLSVGESMPFEIFADRLIEQSGLTWPSKDQTNAHSTMQFVVKRTVIDIMETFGVLECEYVTDRSRGYELTRLVSICLTLNGKGLLGLV